MPLDTVHTIVELPRTTSDVGEMLLNSHKQEKAANRNVFLKIVWYFACQGLPLCSHNDAESFSSFMQKRRDPALANGWKEKVIHVNIVVQRYKMRSWRSCP